jgi:hypothetical protein
MPSLKKFTHDDYPARSRQKQYSCYTRSIDAETLLAFRYSSRLAPVFIQERIQKKAEYRLILISKHDLVCRIDAKHINDAEVTGDWCVTEPDKLVHVPDKLPIEYVNKLHQMLDELGLNFGAFDIRGDEDDTLYFIELNPNRQWYWSEILTKMPMVSAMVEHIEDLALQYQQDC